MRMRPASPSIVPAKKSQPRPGISSSPEYTRAAAFTAASSAVVLTCPQIPRDGFFSRCPPGAPSPGPGDPAFPPQGGGPRRDLVEPVEDQLCARLVLGPLA